MADETSGRRRFLKNSAALAGLALAPAATLLAPRSAQRQRLRRGRAGHQRRLERAGRGPLRPPLPFCDHGALHRGAEPSGLDPAAPQSVPTECAHAGRRSDGHHHPDFTALHDAALLRHPGHQPGRAQAHDPRHGRAAVDLHRRRAQADAVRLADSFHRVHRQSAESERQIGRRHARPHGVQRVDRRVALAAAQRGRASRTRRNGSSPRAPKTASTPRAYRCPRRWTM